MTLKYEFVFVFAKEKVKCDQQTKPRYRNN